MKMKWRPRARWLWLAGGSAASIYLWMNRRLFTVNDVIAGKSKDYPSIKPHAYAFPTEQVFIIAEMAARSLPRWRVTSVDRIGREIQAEAETALFSFFDDITIRVDPIPNSRISEVTVRSRSRKGVGDLGNNARNIRAFYQSLDKRMRNATGVAPVVDTVVDKVVEKVVDTTENAKS
ncbi:MAG TPA: DUF1499 domain-containing protein [Armatimonadota bacterium]|nr:DUF1499 domain-containing protein [Armatimonadota bacterium]